MSGITPILDTLLHQVLGKRVDHPPPRDLNEPLRPLNAADAARALHSDSRLDGRRPPIAELTPTATRGEGRPALPAAPAAPPGGSFQTHFSPTARTIADLLLRFPAPPSAVRPAAPLMPPGESPSADALAQRLEGSIRHSGLFHESHLARWYRGELPRAALTQDPQQWRTLTFRPAPAEGGVAAAPWRPAPGAWAGGSAGVSTQGAAPMAGGGGASPLQVAAQAAGAPGGTTPAPFVPTSMSTPTGGEGSGRGGLAFAEIQALGPSRTLPGGGASPGGSAGTPSTPPGPTAPSALAGQAPGPAQALAGEALEASREPAPVRGGEPIAESLQGVLRHQLELLVNPVIRWEGDVWSGIFMALAIQLPAGFEERARQEAEEEGGQDEAWASELTLVLPGLGELAVQLRLVARRLNLTLDSPEAAVVSRLEAGLPRLARRLEALGFEARLAARHRPEEGE